MIVVLLLVIIAILLFGAAAVKHAAGRTAMVVLTLCLAFAAIVVVAPHLNEIDPAWFIGGALVFAGALWIAQQALGIKPKGRR